MNAIIVSGMPAVGKTTVSKLLGDALGLKVVGGGDVLKEMAAEDSPVENILTGTETRPKEMVAEPME